MEWKPTLRKGEAPLYMTLAEILLADVVSGDLPPGSRLPNQRELAEFLGTSVGTVTRAYQMAESRGAIDSTPGRGTFVRRPETGGSVVGSPLSLDPSLVDLSVAHPLYAQEPALAATLADISLDVDLQRLLRYQNSGDNARYRAAGVTWLEECGVPSENRAVIMAAGAQHAGFVLTLALSEPGDLILVDELTYPGYLSVLEQTRRRVKGVPMDGDGMIPEALREVCERERPTVLYLIPTLHNPTGTLMPEARRIALAEIAQEHGLLVIEDDTLRLLVPDPPPTIVSLVPDRGFFIGSMSKAVSGGLRLAFVSASTRYADAIRTVVGATVFMSSPLLLEIATRWIEDGTAMDTVARKRVEIRERQRVAREILPTGAFQAHPQSYYLWLQLTEGWRSAEFEAEARRRGVGVTPSRPFAADPSEPPDAVRICLSAAENRERLEEALRTLAHLLANPGSRTPGLL